MRLSRTRQKDARGRTRRGDLWRQHVPPAYAARHHSVIIFESNKTTALQQPSVLMQDGNSTTHPLLPIRGRDAAEGLTTVAKVDETKLSDRPEPGKQGQKQQEPLRKHNTVVFFFGFGV